MHLMSSNFCIIVPLLGICDATFVFSKLLSAEKPALNLEVAAAHGQAMGDNIERVCKSASETRGSSATDLAAADESGAGCCPLEPAGG